MLRHVLVVHIFTHAQIRYQDQSNSTQEEDTSIKFYKASNKMFLTDLILPLEPFLPFASFSSAGNCVLESIG